MKGKAFAAGVLMLAGATVLAMRARSQSGARILVGPDMLISRDGDIPHVELMAAANPLDPNNLIAGGITNTRPTGGWACRTYASLDGGSTWTMSAFPEQNEWGGGDPQVAFGEHGTAFFTALLMRTDSRGTERGFLYLYRSEDGGVTWQKPLNMGYSYDHEQITVDRTMGRFAGRIYVGVEQSGPPNSAPAKRHDHVGIFRSDDDGRTFTGPVEAVDSPTLGTNVANLLVLSDGTLFVPYVTYPLTEEARKSIPPQPFYSVLSTDGGLTFSRPRKINEQIFSKDPEIKEYSTFAEYAADTQSEKHRDRIYAAWNDFRLGGHSRMFLSYSTDRGVSWTTPHQVDPSVPATATQFQPMVAVSPKGVVAVTWFDSRNSSGIVKYDQYFAASVDGGETFLPAVRISSETSDPRGPGNVALSPSLYRLGNYEGLEGGHTRIGLTSAGSRWGDGGDYMGLTVDSNGVFHPVWADSRTGTFQMRTASVSVEAPDQAAAENKERRSAAKKETDITNLVDVVFDPSHYDGAAQELDLPVRLRNISHQVLYGPITLRIEGFGSGMGKELREYSPTISNARNGKDGVGATFEFSDALGTEGRLAPGAQSGSITIKFKLKDAFRTPDVHIVVDGYVAQE